MTEARTATRPSSSSESAPTRNSDVDWDSFNSVKYRNHNYKRSVREDDRKIVQIIRDFFGDLGLSGARGVDVGPGSNLYPSLAMLPFCKSLDLREFSASNVRWLERQKDKYDRNWDRFWALYRQHPAYASVADPRELFREIATVKQDSVFELPKASWDLGTMFFVACSLSSDRAEFVTAVHRFVQALVPGAPFATAFMEQSKGYRVGDVWFPAVAIGVEDVEHAFSAVARDLHITEIKTPNPLRKNVGMIVATGRATR